MRYKDYVKDKDLFHVQEHIPYKITYFMYTDLGYIHEHTPLQRSLACARTYSIYLDLLHVHNPIPVQGLITCVKK